MHLRLALVASLAAAVLAVGPATASAGTYDYLVAPMTNCGGQKQINTSLSPGEQEAIMGCLHNYAREDPPGGYPRQRAAPDLERPQDSRLDPLQPVQPHGLRARDLLPHQGRRLHVMPQLERWREHRLGLGQLRQPAGDHDPVGQLDPSPRQHPQLEVHPPRCGPAQGYFPGSLERPGVDDALRVPQLLS